MKKKKGFTLVELLAVIVILAVILIIAIPQIMNTIKTTRLKSIEDSARLIATNADKDYLAQQAINSNYNATSIPCTDVAKLSKDYSSCKITYNDSGIATVRLKGADGGKFNGITCTGTKDNMKCRRSESSGVIYALGWPKITNLTYDIDYDKCMESILAMWTASDKELFCTDKETSEGTSIKKIIKTYGMTNNRLIDEGAVTNLKLEYEQITDYNSLNSNVFVRLPKGEEVYDDLTPKSVCIKYKGKTNNEINCFEYDNYEYEEQHLIDVFGEDKYTTGTYYDDTHTQDVESPYGLLYKMLGIEKVYASEGLRYAQAIDDEFSCRVVEDGYVGCSYRGEGYKIFSNGEIEEILP